jgi:hypothetical protein
MQNLSAQEQAIHDERVSILGALDNMNYISQTWCLSRKELSLLKDQGLPVPPEPGETFEVMEVPYEESVCNSEPADIGGGETKDG